MVGRPGFSERINQARSAETTASARIVAETIEAAT
jgi:hypothetical protein